ncbi:MAG: TrkA family potassium uptake protein [Clostridiales bacterium]|nr:TrkA family potassium uptake protein [Clostridiales bacterium]
MKSFLLIGAGKFGKSIAMELNRMGQQVMIVDKNEDLIEDIMPYVTDGQIGDCSNKEFLRLLGVSNFDTAIVTIAEDFQSSLETTLNLKELGAKHVIARALNDVHEKFLLRNGADEVIFPEKQMAKWIAVRYSANNILDYVEIDGDCSMFELQVPSSWIGKTVVDLNVRNKYDINIIALKKNQKMNIFVKPDTVLEEDMTMFVVGEIKNLQKSFHVL